MEAFVFLRLRQANRRNALRRHRANLMELRLNSSPFDLPETRFKKLFRLDKNATRELITKLEPFNNATSIPFEIQVLTSLHFYGQGSYQVSIGSNSILGLSQPSVSRSIRTVTDLIIEHVMDEVIKFPHTILKKVETQQSFHTKFGMRCVLGAIDGCHIAIVSPPEMDEYLRGNVYRNRKGYHSINVLVCCDAEMRVTYADARFPGSTHDSAIWSVSPLRAHFRSQFTRVEHQDSFLIGDSGFPLEPWLMTPFRATTGGTQQHLFNEKLINTRQIIERCFGVVKSRFRCLSKHRVLHYDPCTAGKIIYAVLCLHNICINNGLYPEHFMDGDQVENDDVNNSDMLNEDQWTSSGYQFRERYIQHYIQ